MKKNFLSIICGMALVVIGLCGCSNDGADGKLPLSVICGIYESSDSGKRIAL